MFSTTGEAGVESSCPFVHYFLVELDRSQLPELSVPGAVECSGIVFMEQGRRRWGHLLGSSSILKPGDEALIWPGSCGRFAKQVKGRLEFGCELLLAGGWQGMSAKYSQALSCPYVCLCICVWWKYRRPCQGILKIMSICFCIFPCNSWTWNSILLAFVSSYPHSAHVHLDGSREQNSLWGGLNDAECL